ncbi:MAG: hypothetical protein JSU86_18145, partial [Phycisphaerales bacterium]
TDYSWTGGLLGCDAANNFRGLWASLPAGTYHFPIYSSPGGSLHGPYQMHITAYPCTRGACCLDGVCLTDFGGTTSQLHCAEMGGTWFSGEDCNQGYLCPGAAGACCDDSTGICQDGIAPADCQKPARFAAGILCADLVPACSEPRGACCDDSTGDCNDDIVQSNCQSPLRFAANTLCANLSPPCTGPPAACCFSGECDNMPQTDCVSQSGVWFADEDCATFTCPAPPTCPSNTLFGQLPYLPSDAWIMGVSDTDWVGGNAVRYESFAALNGPICDVHWWGIAYGTGGPCTENPMTFIIKFYENAAGALVPGNEVCSYTATVTGTLTGWPYSVGELLEYHVDLPTCCSLSTGWISIQATGGSPDCWFWWTGSPDGNAQSCFHDGTTLDCSASTYDLSVCLTGATAPLGACCVDGACVGTTTEVNCQERVGLWYQGEDCATFICPEACCFSNGTCQDIAKELCVAQGGAPQGAGRTCADVTCPLPTEACCRDDGLCRDLTAAECVETGGTPRGPGTQCLGDGNGNNIDDACEDGPCDGCGPGSHWVDQCRPGDDLMVTGAIIGIAMDDDCVVNTSLRLHGPVHVRRSDPRDDSIQFPGLRPLDGHLDVIDTEIVSMSLTDGLVTLTAGGGLGQGGILRRSNGAIAEQRADNLLADSFFDVFFEVDLGGGVYAYNREPLRVYAKINCVPPDATYIHPRECIMLWDTPVEGEGRIVAYLVQADHSTYPECGDPTTGSCFETHDWPYCDDLICCKRVCERLATCCTAVWDESCVEVAQAFCEPPQACCFEDGSCSDYGPTNCQQQGGRPQGEETSCTASQACCLTDGSCLDVDVLCCDEFGGTPMGEGTTCASGICGCPGATITIEILTDAWPYETTWELFELGVGIVASGGPYTLAYALNTEEVCVSSTSCYDFTIYDSYGDGIYAPGGYKVSYNGTVLADTMGMGWSGLSETVSSIGDGCTPPGACCILGDCVSGKTQESCEAQEGTWFADERCADFNCPYSPCAPTPSGMTCEQTECPTATDKCVSTVVSALNGWHVEECTCIPEGACHVVLGPDITPPVWCEGSCLQGEECRLIGTDADGDGTDDTFECRCEPASCEQSPYPACRGGCPPGSLCKPSAVAAVCVCESITCEQSPYPNCVGECPVGRVCKPDPTNAVCACEPVECAPTADGIACEHAPCTGPNDMCVSRCINYDPQTGVAKVIACECLDPNRCHVRATTSGPAGNPCVVPDNGNGTITLPPAGCDYLGPDEVHEIIDGLPPGTTIELDPIHMDFICSQDGGTVCSLPLPPGECELPGGTLGGHGDCFQSTLDLTVRGTGSLTGFNRHLAVPIYCEVHTGPRNPGDPVQTFPNDMFRLQGELFGDPDFCTFHVVGGTDFGLPSPGQTTLTQLPSGDFAVDSFFDITYQIEFEGCLGTQLADYGGTTTATIRMQTGTGTTCAGGCPSGTVCDETIVQNPDGTVDVCCHCVTPPSEACCLRDGGCDDGPPSGCLAAGGRPQGPGTTCSDTTAACCNPDSGACVDVDPLCCDDIGGVPSPTGAAACRGDQNKNGIDDACEEGVVERDVFPETVAQVLLEVPGPIMTPDSELPPTRGVYRSAAQEHAVYSDPGLEVVLQDIRHQVLAYPPPVRTALGADEREVFQSVAVGTALVSVPGTVPELVPVELRGPVETLVREKADQTTGSWDAEIVSMSLSGNIPGVGPVQMQESPTLSSAGQTGIQALGGGGQYSVDSFFDVFTELSVDGGNSWIGSTGSVRMELVEQVLVSAVGPAEAHVYFEGPEEGVAYDDDHDGYDEVKTELVNMDLRGHSPMGPVAMGLRDGMPSTGQIMERVNQQPGKLEVAPFIATGDIPADSFFDVWPEIRMGGQVLYTTAPLPIKTLIHHKPPQDGERYVNPYLQPVELIDPLTGQGTGILVIREVHQPDPTVEYDIFERTRALVALDVPSFGLLNVVLRGTNSVHVFFEGPQEGDAVDDDLNGRDEVITQMKTLDLQGHHPALGEVILRLNPDEVTLGQIEENANVQLGRLDVPPFGAEDTTADSFFDVLFEIEIPSKSMVLHNNRPVRMVATITQKPPGPGDEYFKPEGPIELYDENGEPTGIVMTEARHVPNPPEEEVEIDVFDFSIGELELTGGPFGTAGETVEVGGSTTVFVFFEGPADGLANDDDDPPDNRDEVRTQMVDLNLTGVSSQGPVHVTLNPSLPSIGGIEETLDISTGVLDVPPFGLPGTTADSFFDIFFQIDVGGRKYFTVDPKRMRSVITHKPPRPGDVYENLEQIELYDQDGNATGIFLSAARHRPRPPVEFDRFDFTIGTLQLRLSEQTTVTVEVTGPATVAVYFEGTQEGAASDDGHAPGLDEVVTRMVGLNLTGFINPTLGPVHVTLNPDIPSMGLIEEQVNNTPGVLDLPPFAAAGSADSFFDIYFEVTVGGERYHTVRPKRMSGKITEKPPGPLDLYEGLQDVQLYDADGNPTDYYLVAARHRPRPPVEVDPFPFSIGAMDLILPDGTTETVEMTGEATAAVYFEGGQEGSANDDGKAEGLDEVVTRMTDLQMHGMSPTLGPIDVTLNPNIPSMGQIEEQVNNTPGVLDLPPFTPTGTADSYFDLYFQVTVAGQTFHTVDPKRMSGKITHKPPGPLDWYEG